MCYSIVICERDAKRSEVGQVCYGCASARDRVCPPTRYGRTVSGSNAVILVLQEDLDEAIERPSFDTACGTQRQGCCGGLGDRAGGRGSVHGLGTNGGGLAVAHLCSAYDEDSREWQQRPVGKAVGGAIVFK
jgi:hypothetical protein